MEILSGHRYAAVKVPDNVVAVIPNRFMLGYVDLADTKNVIASPDLISFAKEKGFYKEYNGKFHTALAYGEPLGDYDRARLWGGQNFLAPSKKIPYNQEVFDLFFKPDKKVSVKDVMELQRYRYEGTKYDGNLPENKDVRVIGVEHQAECHVVQIKDSLPKKVGGVLWLAMGNAEHSVYLPTYGNITDTYKAYQLKTADYNPESAYWIFRSLSTLAELNREKYGASVRKYWSEYQDNLIAAQAESDKKIIELYKKNPDEAAKYATDHGKKLASDAITKARRMYAELFTYIASETGRAHKEPFVLSLAESSDSR